MEGTRMAEGLTPEELAEAQRNFEVMKEAARRGPVADCLPDGGQAGQSVARPHGV